MTPDQAATVALKGLAYLVNFQPELNRFLELSGADRATLRERADEPEFLAALLDFMLANEAVMIDFCNDTFIDARLVHEARNVLSGG
ncbi:MAG TPA: DUF3572 domain-containing protein [Rhizomicrobium sp.]|jgi:hypothetical protein|nr:DUF3572 domain-containing protein [Rhizomicrobium sp.]